MRNFSVEIDRIGNKSSTELVRGTKCALNVLITFESLTCEPFASLFNEPAARLQAHDTP
jgi:hypothetical protein